MYSSQGWAADTRLWQRTKPAGAPSTRRCGRTGHIQRSRSHRNGNDNFVRVLPRTFSLCYNKASSQFMGMTMFVVTA
jgi:hypothetical protein